MPSAGMAGASTGSDSVLAPKAKRSTRASKISSDKRAFRRAQRRALANGSTMYRGRVCAAASLGCHQHMHAPAQDTHRVSPSTCRPTRTLTQHRRLKVVSFNVGGLCASSYDIMANWLQGPGKQYDVVMLQETHYGLGKHLLEYTLPGWSVVSSPDPMHRDAGVAIVISHKIASADAIQYRAVGLYPARQALPDSHAFGDMVKHAGLCALNTWTRARTAYTFEMPGEVCKRTQIDFVLASPNVTDLCSKRSAPTDDMCFAPWRGGGRHRAVVACLRLDLPLRPTALTTRPSFSRCALREALRTNSTESQRLKELIQERLSHVPPASTESLNSLLVACCENFFPNLKRPKAARPWQTSEIQASVHLLWTQRQAMSAAKDVYKRSRDLGSMFQLWKSVVQFNRVQSQLRKRSYDKRRAILEETLHQADAAAKKGDMYTLYRHIRNLAPRQCRRRVQLHSAQGAMLSVEQEYQLIYEYFSGVFNRDQRPSVQSPALRVPFVIDVGQVAYSLNQQRPGRAVPTGSAPPELFHAFSEVLSPAVCTLFSACLKPGILAFAL